MVWRQGCSLDVAWATVAVPRCRPIGGRGLVQIRLANVTVTGGNLVENAKTLWQIRRQT
jgi:hypothetical protein